MVELHDTAGSPHDTTTPDGFESDKSDGEHFTKALTVNGDEPLGREDGVGVETNEPRESVKAEEGKKETLEVLELFKASTVDWTLVKFKLFSSR